MTNAFTLKTLLDLAQDKSDAAATRLGRLNVQAQSAEQKLQLLIEYRRDYENNFQELSKTGVDQAKWLNFRAFMGKLDTAISEQQKTVLTSQDRVQIGRNNWHAEQHKLKTYDTLSQRHRAAEIRRASKQEQREQDELTIKSHSHRTAS
jgi:flagellar protein FliJ